MLQRKIGTWGLFWIAFSSMINSGWLFAAFYSAKIAGPAAVIAWPLAGILMFIVALSYAEIATMFPQSGALVRLPLYTHGRLACFLMTWFGWIAVVTIPAIEVQALLQYSSHYLPQLLLPHHGNHLSILGYEMAIGLLALFVFLNYFGVLLFSHLNTLFSMWKLVIPVLTMLWIVSVSFHLKNFNTPTTLLTHHWHGVLAALSTGGVFFSLLGFRQIISMIGETSHPKHSIPLVLISSLLSATLVYTALQVTFIGALPPTMLTHGWTALVFTGDAGPFFGLATLLGLFALGIILYVDAVLTPFSTGFVFVTTGARMAYTMGDLKQLPKIFSHLNRFDIPWVGLCINGLFSALIFAMLSGWQAMTAFLVSAMLISYAMGPVSLSCLRRQLPNYPRPFRLHAGHCLAFLGFYICSLGVYWAGFANISRLLILTSISLACYLIYQRGMLKPSHPLDTSKAWWIFAYVLGLWACSYLGNYGGRHFLPQSLAFLLLLLLSLSVFLWAVYTRHAAEHVLAHLPKPEGQLNDNLQHQ